MADILTDFNGLPLLPPDQQIAADKEALRAAAGAPNAYASFPLTLAYRDPKAEGYRQYIPAAGLGESLAGLGHFAGTRLATLGNAALDATGMASRWGLHIPNPPDWMEQAGERFEENRADWKNALEKYSGGVLPQPDMNTTTGQVVDMIAPAVAAGIGVTPASVIAALPRGTRTAASLLLDSRGHAARNVPINVGLTTAQEVEQGILHPDTAQAQAAPDSVAAPSASSTQQSPAPSNAFPLEYSSPAQEKTNAFPLEYEAETPRGSPFPLDGGDAGITFSQQGESGVSIGESLFDLILLGGGVAAGGAAYRRGAAITTAARDARLRDPAYAAKVNDYNNAVIARGPGSGTISAGADVTAPLPEGNAIHRAATYVNDKLLNDAAKDQDYINLTLDNPTVAQRLTSQLGNMHDTALQHNQLLHFIDTGVDRQTNIKMPALGDLARDVGNLSADDRTLWNEAIRARGEIEGRSNRQQAFNNANPGKIPGIDDIRHDFIGKPTEELQVIADRIKSDPVFMDLANRYKGITDGMIDLGNHSVYNFFDAAEAARLKTQRAYYVPEFSADGRLMHPFGPRDVSAYTGQAHGGVDPIVALTAHIEKLYPLFQQNQIAQQLRRAYLNFQNAPGAPKFMTEINSPTGAHATYYPKGMSEFGGQPRDPIVVVRDNGIHHMRVDNPDIHRMMTGGGIADSRVHLDGLDVARRLYQKGTTAGVSVITGRAMPLRNALFTSTALPINSAKNEYGGLLDRFVQRKLGVTSSIVRGADVPLNWVAMFGSDALSAKERFTKRFADLTHPSADNIANRTLRSIAGDPVVDSMSRSAQARWEKSTAHFIAQRGMSGNSSPIRTEAPGIATGTKAGMLGERNSGLRLQTARLAPRAYIDGRWAGGRAALVNTQQILGDVFNSFGDIGHDYWIRLNKANPTLDPDTLVYRGRNIVGNPSRTGSSTLLQAASSALPYTNVSVQGTGRFLSSVAARPGPTALTIASGLGTAALLTILTHMRSAAHMDYLQNNLSLQQREANIILALNDDPTKPTEIAVPQEYRTPNAFMQEIVATAVNLLAARHDPDVFKAVWDGITHFLGTRISHNTMDAMIHGLVDVADFANLPPMLGREDWNAVLHGRSFFDAYHGVGAGTQTTTAPGQGYDGPLDSANGQLFERLLSSVFGAAANTLEIPNAAMRYQAQGHPFWESLGMAGQDWLQMSREFNPALNNMVWETQLRLSLNPPIAEALQPALYALKKLPTSTPERLEGYVGKGAATQLPVPMTQDKAVSGDILIRQMLLQAHAYESKITQAMEPIKAIEQQMQAVSRVGMDPAERRAWLNQRTREIADKYKLVNAYVSDLDNSMSNMAGKSVRIQDIDFSKDSSQFK